MRITGYMDPHSATPIPSWDLIDRWLAGECTPAEELSVRAALGAPASAAAAELRSAIAQSRGTERDLDALLARFRSRPEWGGSDTRATAEQPAAQRGQLKSQNATRLLYGGIGVAICALIIAVLPIIKELHHTTKREAPSSLKSYSTTAGQRAHLTLPDGSTLVLAPESRIRYDGNFGESSNRTVMLDGQALFNVTQSGGMPFVVQAGNVSTRVLGTSFAVRRYAEDTAVTVVVAQGKVAIGQAVLNRGEIAVATGGKRIVISRDNAVSDQLAWTEGRLVFDETPLRDIVAELERWYGITVEVDDPALLDRRVALTLDSETAPVALDLIAFAVRGRVELHGSRAILHSR